ncbi:stage II sporulation protein M [Asaccharospora irregularis]|uniref:Stage II sporulation protein M n=1 Tax=Asaccharospora irregularis DSM 2635 TaxID=1121321 RepID=A0A1M5K0I0_9FIRM|nr:stage II sporulation protein M [Asaccharospora irregularis]SHG46195.1 stage II sporulation protein M [Asaccharospora irregularis DSM 2635]
MRRTYRKNNFRELDKPIVILGLIFVATAILGAYLNKVFINSENTILEVINPIVNYYNGDINLKEAVLSNLKSDIIFIVSICISTLFVVTIPILIIIFILKGMSVGYTINSAIITLKLKSIKVISLIFIKNIFIIPAMIILTLISINYAKEVIYALKKNRKDNIISLIKRYLLNATIILLISVSGQMILNTISIGIIKLLVK